MEKEKINQSPSLARSGGSESYSEDTMTLSLSTPYQRGTPDGIHCMIPRDQMCSEAILDRDVYALKPNAPIPQREFGYYSLEAWKEQGLLEGTDLTKEFGFDPSGKFSLGGLGWCEAAFTPEFEEKWIRDGEDNTEIIQDKAGRHLLVFKGRRQGFMPEYLDHPVKDQKTWEEKVKWRLDPESEKRYSLLQDRLEKAKTEAQKGKIICQGVIGGYMYLRSLMGPEELLYAFYDSPELLHDCMKTWLELADAVTAYNQKHVTLDEIFFAEDICYNAGPLIGPEMIREFLFPYYQQLINNLRSRQLDQNRHLYVQVDTDGAAHTVIDLYREEIGMDVMSPFEVASGCDIVEIGKQHPYLVMSGGIDKRILAEGPNAIDRELDRIMPTMKRRGGYIPTCDHGVPPEVTLENYRHYRKKMLVYAT